MSKPDPARLKVVAWDFDGVLNSNVENGVFAWSKTFEQDLGLSLQSFTHFLFGGRFQRAMVGEACLRELVTEWSEANGAAGRADEILAYWFQADAIPDEQILQIVSQLKARGLANVMATNNEIHRTHFIEHDMGFGLHMDKIFAAGRMKLAKPDSAYFVHIEETLEIDPAHLLLVDDLHENILAARGRGWQTFHFTPGSHVELTQALGL